MTTYNDVFGSNTVPPSEQSYASFNLTANSTFVWPFNADTTANSMAAIMDITCSAGVVLTLPEANSVSVGEDFLIRNTGANTLTVVDNSGGAVGSVAAGAAVYFYVKDNSTVAGQYGVIAFGVGTSAIDAATLVGFGLKAIGTTLNVAHDVTTTSNTLTIVAAHRAQAVVSTGGALTINLSDAVTLGNNFFFFLRNGGTGTLTIDPSGVQLIDGQTSMDIQPGESLMLFCSGTAWYSVGYGRSVLYQFTQLIKDVSAGGTFTLTSVEASNKLLTFIGNPASAVTVVVPNVVSVYYILSSLSTAQSITVKTSAGTGVVVPQNSRIIALCDATNVVSAQSVQSNTSVSLVDGSASLPSLNFASKTNTGLYKSSIQDLGVAVNGASVATFGSNGMSSSTIGANDTQRHTVPAVASDTVALLVAAQTLTNKTISADNNTISGIAASSFVLSNASGNIDGAAAQKAIPSGVVVGTTDTQTLTNKTVNLTSNTLSGTKAQFDTALSDDNFAYIGTANQFSVSQVISVTDNTNAALRITQLGTGNALLVEDAANPDASPFVIDANGFVVAGHSSATTAGLSHPGRLATANNVAATGQGVQIAKFRASPSLGADLEFVKSASTTLGANAVLTSTDVIGDIWFNGADGSTYVPAAKIQAAVDGTPSTGSMPGRLVFFTTPSGSSTPVEAMRIDSSGNVGIGSTSLSGQVLRVGTNITGSTSANAIWVSSQIQSDVTTIANYFTGTVNQAAGTVLGAVRVFNAEQGTLSGTVTNQFGFAVQSNLVGATNNYGFYGNIPAGTNRWNFYANGTANNAFAGNTRFGSTTAPTNTVDVTGTASITANSASAALTITQTGTGNTLVVEDATSPDSSPFVIDANGNVVVGHTTRVTNTSLLELHGVSSISAYPGLASYSWNSTTTGSPSLGLYKSQSGTIGTNGAVSSGATGTIQFHFDDGAAFIRGAQISATVDGTPATGSMPGRLVFFTTPSGSSTPVEAMRIDSAGRTSIGPSAAGASTTLRLSKVITGATSGYGISSDGTVQSDVTVAASYFRTAVSTQDAAFTLATLSHYEAAQGTVTGGSRTAPTNQYGFWARNSLVGATNNYGFLSDIASGTGRWNFYAAGTAKNYFGGYTNFASTDAIKLPVGTTAQRPATAATGDIRYNTETISFEGYNGTSWGSIGAGAKGGGADQVFFENDVAVTTDYTITTNKNAMTAGPVTINNGVTVTIPNGSVWTIV